MERLNITNVHGMRKTVFYCPDCRIPLEQKKDSYFCPNCARYFPVIDCIPSFIDQSVDNTDSFNPEAFESLYEMEQRHFWHVGRKGIILQVLQQNISDLKNIYMLEIGCGNGNILAHLKQNEINIAGSDIFLEGLVFCRKRVSAVDLYQINILSMPFHRTFDVIGAFDVLEHIDNDTKALSEISGALKTGGSLLLTVPAYKFLWSYFDERSRHQRRYSKQELVYKLEEAGFRVVKVSYYMFFLFPVFAVSRILNNLFINSKYKREHNENLVEVKTIPIINDIFLALLRIEEFIIKYTNLPFGASLLALGVKRDEEQSEK
jgi:SAM-dependent methyltransferase